MDLIDATTEKDHHNVYNCRSWLVHRRIRLVAANSCYVDQDGQKPHVDCARAHA